MKYPEDSNITSLSTAKKLQLAGFPQDTLYLWSGGELFLRSEADGIAAPTPYEIEDRLPDNCRVYRAIESGYEAGSQGVVVQGITRAEALASLWLKLQGVDN